MRKNAIQVGFTLIEVVISLVILASILVGGMSFFANADQLLSLAMHKKLALEAASSKLEDLKKAGYANLPAVGSPDVLTITVGNLSAQQTTVVTDIDDPVDGVTDYKEVKVEVLWVEADNASRIVAVDLVTYIVP